MPGILTALAAIITATGGLIAVLVQGGVLGPGERATSGTRTEAASVARDAQKSTEAAPEPAGRVSSSEMSSAGISRSPADVLSGLRAKGFQGWVVTHSDGTVVPLSPDGSDFPLDNGQRVAYDRIKSIEVQHPWTGNVRFTLVNGQQLDGNIGRYWSFSGVNELGSYHGDFRRIERIDVLRGND